MNGIYILANDFVYHQLVALINSIEVNVGTDMPICIVPYDDRLEKVRAEIARRPQVSLFENPASIQRWEAFSMRVWQAHDRAQKIWYSRGLPSNFRLAMHRKLCCLDGPFDHFIYFDADTLAMGSVEPVFEKLAEYDWVTNDYQYCSDLKYIFDAPRAQLLHYFEPTQLESHIFCAGWFASKKGVFTDAILDDLLHKLEAGEADCMAIGGPDQSLMNYMVLRSGISYHNLAYHGGGPGSHWSSDFEERDHVLYDQGRRLMYLHYMSVATKKFNALCEEGADFPIPYRDLFLHYRYLKAPQECPTSFKASKKPSPFSRFINRKIGNLKYRFRQLQAAHSRRI